MDRPISPSSRVQRSIFDSRRVRAPNRSLHTFALRRERPDSRSVRAVFTFFFNFCFL
ncbi:hypothetical protein BDY21DRAFT_353472 [Lineolata rhizophorae]|uniref:Uncharacterized protein n=1 Tax=Lineolata rhizophorae TaxID=578093 RepID=A0A6A6NR28_9PEZI|nr:hypothetical protein BDY21DRAFT_353472 [Lineolata rhizophorae]